MGKIKNLGYQIYSALNEINLQDADKRTALFNSINHTDLNYVGKREFKSGRYSPPAPAHRRLRSEACSDCRRH